MKSYTILFMIVLWMGSPYLQAQTIPHKTEISTQATVVAENVAESQAQYWFNRTIKDASDSKAWVQYYQWTERSTGLSVLQKQNQLETIVQSAKHSVPESWAERLIQYLHSDLLDTSALQEAIALSPNETLLLPYAIQSAIIHNNPGEQKKYGERLNQLAPISNAMLRYHKDCLTSAAPDAIIYAKGLNDLIPLSILQQVYGIRKDIQLKFYTKKLSYQPDTYLCLSLGKQILQQYPNAQYTGLLVKLSNNNKPSDELEKHIEQILKKGALPLEELQAEEKLIYRNYLPALILLYKKYEKSDAAKSKFYKTHLLKIAAASNSLTPVKKIVGLE